jgi:hypothetical protein
MICVSYAIVPHTASISLIGTTRAVMLLFVYIVCVILLLLHLLLLVLVLLLRMGFWRKLIDDHQLKGNYLTYFIFRVMMVVQSKKRSSLYARNDDFRPSGRSLLCEDIDSFVAVVVFNIDSSLFFKMEKICQFVFPIFVSLPLFGCVVHSVTFPFCVWLFFFFALPLLSFIRCPLLPHRRRLPLRLVAHEIDVPIPFHYNVVCDVL